MEPVHQTQQQLDTDPAAVFKCYACFLTSVAIQGIDSTFLRLFGWAGTA